MAAPVENFDLQENSQNLPVLDRKRADRIDYYRLHHGPLDVDARDDDEFEIDSVVTRRGSRYLCAWAGYGPSEWTWEPLEHLSNDSLEAFRNPALSEDYVQFCEETFVSAVRSGLNGRTNTFSVKLNSDYFRYLFGDTLEKQFQLEQFGRISERHWHKVLRNPLEGREIVFPLTIRPMLFMRKVLRFDENNNVVEEKKPVQTWLVKMQIAPFDV